MVDREHSVIVSSRACQHLSYSPSAQPTRHFTVQAKLSNDELLSGYTSAVDAHLSGLLLPSISSPTSSPTLIDTLLDQVTDILHTVARNHVPAKRYRPFVKPGWTPELKQHHSKSKKLYKEWVRAGRPRSYLNQKRKRTRMPRLLLELSYASTKETREIFSSVAWSLSSMTLDGYFAL